jgi:hypothetical protein
MLSEAKHLRLILEVLRSAQFLALRRSGGKKRVLRLHLALDLRPGNDFRAGKENQANRL